jgi:ABC-type glycerol-3-phosphate transport system permease component
MNMERELYFASPAELKKYKRKQLLSSIGLYSFLTLVEIFILIPFYWMLITAFKTNGLIELEETTGVFYLFPQKSRLLILTACLARPVRLILVGIISTLCLMPW